MAKNIRIIPRLDIKGPNVVKGIHTEGLRIIGEPQRLAAKYFHGGADELIYMDVVASLYRRNLDFDLLRLVADKIFIPLTVGGGIRSLHDIQNALRAGADKIAINTFAISNPDFLNKAVKTFGAQCIVLSVEAKKTGDGIWEAYTDGGRERTGINVLDWIKHAESQGVGEILLTSIDADGTRKGYEIELCHAVMSSVNIPVIIHGGAGNNSSIITALNECSPDALAISSIFHYKNTTIRDLKHYLFRKKINVRTT